MLSVIPHTEITPGHLLGRARKTLLVFGEETNDGGRIVTSHRVYSVGSVDPSWLLLGPAPISKCLSICKPKASAQLQAERWCWQLGCLSNEQKPVMLAVGMLSQEVHSEIEASLVCIVSSMPQSYRGKPHFKNKIKPKIKTK